jgi:SAM-dependent methyltransferase
MENKNLDQLDNLMLSYSSIIGPEEYNAIMTDEHLYIDIADRYIKKTITEKSKDNRLQVVELGCGPARVLRVMVDINNIDLTAVDIDPVFCDYTKKIIHKKNPNVDIICSDIGDYKPTSLVDIFYSQGFHHHVAKGPETQKYLTNIYNNLKEGGCYILSDEFVPHYTDNNDRNTKLVIWYSHIIAHALRNSYNFLATEEAKTLLDDLQEGAEDKGIKSQEQLNLVLSYVEKIDVAAKSDNMSQSEEYAENFLNDLSQLFSINIESLEKEMYLSRRDYKICDKVLRQEVEQVGFIIEKCKSFGPIDNIGGMSVYILRK